MQEMKEIEVEKDVEEVKIVRPKVLITRRNVPDVGLEKLRQKCDIIYCNETDIATREEIMRKIEGVDGVLWATTEKLNVEILDAAGPQLRVVSTLTSGYDRVDFEELERRNIQLGHTPGVVNNAVADQAIGLMIAAARRHYEGRRLIEKNDWRKGEYILGRDIADSVVGFVGFGGIGQTIAKRLTGFDVQTILYTGPTEKPEAAEYDAEFVTLSSLVRESDIIFICAPLTAETRCMFNLKLFKTMEKKPILINVARGAIVNTDDLVIALSEGLIFAAGLDVMYPEPLPMDHILLKFENCIITPHSGASTKSTQERMMILAIKNIYRSLAGKQMSAQVIKTSEM